MQINVSVHSGTPIYEQICRQIRSLVGSHRLRAGDELPSIRALANQLVVNPNTVARAYRELEVAGVVVKRGTAGTFVADQASAQSARQRAESLRQQVDAVLRSASELGFTTQDVLNMIQERDQSLVDTPESST